jgi:chemotaxis protein MotB
MHSHCKKGLPGLRLPQVFRYVPAMKRVLGTVLALATAACVSTGKYDSVAANLKECQDQMGSCSTDRDQARQRVTELEGQVATLTAGRGELEGSLGATQKELEQLRRQNEEAQKRLAAFKSLTARFQKMIDSGKLQVGFRNGLMIVKLPAGILFASGRADLSREGEAALTEVASVLRELQDRRFLITGHTDNVPLARGRFKDNWELSTARALVVSRWLVAQGVAPTQIAAAGYAEFDPVSDNSTEEGKQGNRRIEIVLMPNIEELPTMPDMGS